MISREMKESIIDELERYKKDGCRGVVIGISGGKDSTTVAMLAKKVWGDDVVGILMPNSYQSDLSDSITIAETLNIKYYVVNIGNAYNALIQDIEIIETFRCGEYNKYDNCPKISVKAKTNIPPRLRMATLYAIGQTMGYRVLGTGNLSESYVGWFTKWGDGAYDFNPIGHLTCSEVIELGKELAAEFGLDEKYIIKTPADGLTGKSDEENLGFTYRQLDSYIRKGTSGNIDVDKKIWEMHQNSTHKRNKN